MNMYNIIVKKIYLGFVILLVFTFSISKSLACDLLSINIGSNKSSIENIFGKIDDTELTISQTETTRSGETNIGGEVSVYMSSKDAFCNEIDFGEVLIKGYVVNNKVG